MIFTPGIVYSNSFNAYLIVINSTTAYGYNLFSDNQWFELSVEHLYPAFWNVERDPDKIKDIKLKLAIYRLTA